MNRRFIIIIVYAVLLSSCNYPTKKDKKDTVKEGKKLVRAFISKPGSSFSDTLILKTACAVFYKPDSVQLKKIEAVNQPMVFEGLMHDCFFQMRNARMVLKKYYPQIKIIETTKARYLLFIKEHGGRNLIDLNSNNDICGIYVFNSEKNPELIDMANVDTELRFYFSNQ